MGKENEREAIIALHKVGWKQIYIVKQLKTTGYNLSRITSWFYEVDTTSDQLQSGRPRIANVPRIHSIIQQKISRYHRKSMKQMASEPLVLSISTERMRHIVKNELRIHVYKLQKAHYLIQKMKATRLGRCRKLLTRIAQNTHKTFLISDDESLFSIQQVVNN